jgi:hypothetical protein
LSELPNLQSEMQKVALRSKGEASIILLKLADPAKRELHEFADPSQGLDPTVPLCRYEQRVLAICPSS